jgi:hypothetical protein
MIEEGHAPARLSRAHGECLERFARQAGLERSAAGGADADAIALDGARLRSVALEKVGLDHVPPQPLGEAESANACSDDCDFEWLHNRSPPAVSRETANKWTITSINIIFGRTRL